MHHDDKQERTSFGSSRGGNGRGNGKTFKWRKPEPHEHNHHIIDGKTHVYNPDTKRWVLESPTGTDHSSGVHIVVNTTSENAEPSASKALVFANAFRAINLALKSLVNQFE
jgi:hypothetical protein